MELNLSGKVALISGSSKGIGNDIAQVLYEEGCKVVINGRHEDAVQKAVAAFSGSVGIAADVSQIQDAKRLVDEAKKQYGKIDILICNVGSGQSVAPGEECCEEWQKIFALNLWSATNLIEAAKKDLIDSKGVILCISSICGVEVIEGAPVTYSVAKAALNAYVRGIARPLGKKNVRINAIAPGNVLFDGSVWDKKISQNKAAVEEMLQKNVALARLGKPRDIAALAAFLVSEKAGFATGAIYTVDGGQVHS